MTQQDMAALDYLVEWARKVRMTPEQTTAQRRSFAYGNTAIENPYITKQMVEEEATRLGL
ncbi:hypothetical protein [Sinirhodobacter huangdaonensis]|uniref:Uncharacterized protein n=1 Tax=Paenirhodobacter huangdaonensis TaxID=2501515 RepID=A0A3S3M5Y2_9RHOB|nr:hypothetical protein [Sinirhodobacter huangdaonensis]RWR48028.1 hypothetical protein EOW66_18700 [Sinirhodobacter huangdaonensis]